MNKTIDMRPPMQRCSPILRRWAALAAVTVFLLAGCDPEPDPTRTPEPSLTYGQVDAALCERLKANQVATRFGLKPRPSYHPTGRFGTALNHTHLSCEFWVYDDGDRFRTPIGEFDPEGTIRLRTYPDHETAEKGHESAVHTLRSSEKSRQGVSTQSVGGWWDEGLYSQLVMPIDPELYPRLKGLDAARVGVVYELRHANLLVTTRLNTQAATPEIEAVLALLRDLANALTNEAVSHLVKTGPD
ncbi:hypothetical protein [Plantactinospora sonchi]|uniref:DUF3558 domain-containing protein n=1 Tax=Plantactinospora sonchi TaxID=1544735 RepID=A0ABU7RSM0_9ACTN